MVHKVQFGLPAGKSTDVHAVNLEAPRLSQQDRRKHIARTVAAAPA